MKKMLVIIGMFLVIGSAGALEVGNIGVLQTILQSLVGISILGVFVCKEAKNGR